DRTDVPLMVTGGFKTRASAIDAVTGGAADVVGLARALVLDPDLPERWRGRGDFDPIFPRFTDPPEGGITAWYTMRLTALGEDCEGPEGDLSVAIAAYETRDTDRVTRWNERFSAVG
ncbi:MAG: oxidoreductase, partial [Shimia sp.]